MNRVLTALALCAPLIAGAAELDISCIGPESDDCPVTVDVVLERETLVASFYQRQADGTLQREEAFWCRGMGVESPYRWLHPAWGICEPTASFRVLGGEFSKRQLAQAGIVFSTRQVQSLCGGGFDTACTAPPLARGQFRLACIGPQSADCPVSVEVNLQGDGLLASFYEGSGSPARRVGFEWCSGFTVTGDAPLRWWALQGEPCPLWGASRPLHGELTLRQLVDAQAAFEIRTTQAACYFEGATLANPSGTKAVCARVQR